MAFRTPGTEHRCVVTAHASLTAIGADAERVVPALVDGASGLAAPSLDVPFRTVTGEVRDLPPMPVRLADHESRVARIACALAPRVAATVDGARRRFGRDRVAIVIGSSTGGLERSEAQVRSLVTTGRPLAGYDFDRQHAMHAVTEVLAAMLDVSGPRYVVSTACASGAKALASARRLLRAGLADAVVAGGIDGLCETTLRGFHALGILSTSRCRPFAPDRDGMNVGEGGALAVLVRDGDGPVELLGAGESTDAFHLSAPDPEGAGAAAAISAALADAGIDAAAIDHVNAHGTGTRQNDAAEAAAIARVLGARVPVTSTKPLVGHLLGAAGAVEADFAMHAIERGFVPGTVGVDAAAPDAPVSLATRTARGAQRVVMSTSFAFGGINAALVLGAAR